MSRQIVALLVLVIGAIGLTVIAQDKAEAPDEPQRHLYLRADKVGGEPMVHIELGDRALFAPKLEMKLKESNSDYEIIVTDGELVMRQKTENGFKELGRNRQLLIPLQPDGSQ